MSDYVFISYSHKDKAYARQLGDDLRERGFEVWRDDRIDFGSRWWQTIVEAVQGCAALIVVMSPDSEASEWVEREVQLALRERKPIFPLLLRGKGFAILITRQYVNVTDERMPPSDFYDRLRQVVSPADCVAPSTGEPEKAETSAPRAPFEPEMVSVPAGELLMGSDPGRDPRAKGPEQPQHVLSLPAYAIAKTPITNAEFLAFVQAVDHPPPSHWANERPPVGEERHPVVQVTWHDVTAYCRWLSGVTGRSDKKRRIPARCLSWRRTNARCASRSATASRVRSPTRFQSSL